MKTIIIIIMIIILVITRNANNRDENWVVDKKKNASRQFTSRY